MDNNMDYYGGVDEDDFMNFINSGMNSNTDTRMTHGVDANGVGNSSNIMSTSNSNSNSNSNSTNTSTSTGTAIEPYQGQNYGAPLNHGVIMPPFNQQQQQQHQQQYQQQPGQNYGAPLNHGPVMPTFDQPQAPPQLGQSQGGPPNYGQLELPYNQIQPPVDIDIDFRPVLLGEPTNKLERPTFSPVPVLKLYPQAAIVAASMSLSSDFMYSLERVAQDYGNNLQRSYEARYRNGHIIRPYDIHNHMLNRFILELEHELWIQNLWAKPEFTNQARLDALAAQNVKAHDVYSVYTALSGICYYGLVEKYAPVSTDHQLTQTNCRVEACVWALRIIQGWSQEMKSEWERFTGHRV